jgi:SOS response regulatory protein OraA/RecX
MYVYALKLLRARDYSVARLDEKLANRFGSPAQDVIQQLLNKNFLNDRRFAENYIARRKEHGRAALREELEAHGVAVSLIDELLAQVAWPSIEESLADKMKRLKLRAPLQSRDAARLFRALVRLGYDEDAIREEIEKLNEQ